MYKRSLSNLKFLEILDEEHRSFYGCSQEWYPGKWQQLAGCGPSAASNIIWYLGHHLPSLGLDPKLNSKKNFLSLMQEVWKYVKPTVRGIPETKLFYEAVLAYTRSKGLNLAYRVCDVPQDKSGRPGFPEVVHFLEEGLTLDAPVAFLNLCNGREKNLERWHWVIVVSLNIPDEDENKVCASVIDGGRVKEIDLSLWFKTTTLGGGFVYFTPAGPGSSQLK